MRNKKNDQEKGFVERDGGLAESLSQSIDQAKTPVIELEQ